jgi:exopolyphosphatase/guanosine-5'-triphosphate,3'-diphosphate pyrophosphatase
MSEEPHRVGVLDVGCFSAHLVVVDRGGGSLLRPVLSHKVRLRLDRAIDSSGRISRDGIVRIAAAVSKAQRAVHRAGVSTVVPFATSVIRDAANADDVVDLVANRTGVEHDVGGGTVEMAVGEDAEPVFAHSLPLGARTLTRTWGSEKLTGKKLRRTTAGLVQTINAGLPADNLAESRRCRAVGCSKVFQQLARPAGARSQRDGQFVARQLRAADLTKWIPRLAKLSAAERAQLPGISEHRAHQSLAGAIAAQAR